MAIPLLYLVGTLQVRAQENYKDYHPAEKTTIINEQFLNNNQKWPTDNKWLAGEIANGTFLIRCKNFQNATGMTYIETEGNLEKDFEMEACIKIIHGSGAMVFGMAPNLDHYRIEINTSKQLVFFRNLVSKGKLDKIYTTKTNLLNNNEFNKITIRKANHRFYLFVNEIFVKELPEAGLYGKLIGFSVSPDSEMEARQISLSYIIHKPPEIKWAFPEEQPITVNEKDISIRANILSYSEIKGIKLQSNKDFSIIQNDSLRKSTIENQFLFSFTTTLLEGHNSFSLNVTNSGGTTTSAALNIRYEKLYPPVITWINPSSNYINQEKATYQFQVSINSSSELDFFDFIFNGASFSSVRSFLPVKKVSGELVYDLLVPLVPGANDIYAIAKNKHGKTISESRTINYNPLDKGNEKRLALVIGNSDYPGGLKLKNPVNDAQLMEKTLRGLHFEVILQTNGDKRSMENAIREFSEKLPGYNVALFYYAGHGLQIDGINYLIPVDAKLNSKNDCKFEAIQVNYVVEEFEQYPDNINIVILDACRNNPYRSWARGGNSGFKAIDPASGTIIAFATSEGATAADGEGYNGLFTEELVKQILVPQSIESVFKKTRVAVEKRSQYMQSPQEWSKLKGDFSFIK
jgi:hypothetical protein